MTVSKSGVIEVRIKSTSDIRSTMRLSRSWGVISGGDDDEEVTLDAGLDELADTSPELPTVNKESVDIHYASHTTRGNLVMHNETKF